MAKKLPSFPFYAQDFLSSLDVQMMSAEEVGAYILLLANSWIQPKQCFLPNEKKALGFLGKIPEDKWETIGKKIMKKFVVEGDEIYNERLLLEKTKYEKFCEKQQNNGKKGGRPPKPTDNPVVNSGKPNGKPKKSLSPSPSPSPSTTTTSPEAEELTVFLFQKIHEVNPAFRFDESVMKRKIATSAGDIDKMLRIDKRTRDQIMVVIDYVFGGEINGRTFPGDTFWQTNIESGLKLRKHFVKLVGKIGVDVKKEEESKGLSIRQ